MIMQYHPEPSDFELRILPDGRVQIVAADEAMFDLAEAIDPGHPALARRRKARERDRTPADKPDA